MTTLNDFQIRVSDWATAKGWMDARITSADQEPKLVEMKLAQLALAHIPLDHAAERIRIDPTGAIIPEPTCVGPNRYPHFSCCNTPIVLSKLGLIHTEVTEAVEAVLGTGVATWFDQLRGNSAMPKGKPEGLGPELADIVIRCFQLAADVGIDLAAEMEQKMDYNDGRPFQHGKQA